MKYIKFFNEINLNDVGLVGGKNASLGQLTMIARSGVLRVPNGFATTSEAYWYFIAENNLMPRITKLLHEIHDSQDARALTTISKRIRTCIEAASIPDDLRHEIISAYQQLSKKNCFVAVRSSATAEDLPHASFAGQHESFLYIKGVNEVIKAWQRCVSSLFTPRAIAYRMINHIVHERVALSVGIQQMINAASSGVAFTLDTESGFNNVIFITAAYGLGETVVQGMVNPDEYYVHKQRLEDGFAPILSKTCGDKQKVASYTSTGIRVKNVTKLQQERFCLSDNQILQLAHQCLSIEKHYSKHYQKLTPMDIEWVKAPNEALYIVQARPETVHSKNQQRAQTVYHVAHKQRATVLLTGQAIGQKIGQGRVFISSDVAHAALMPEGSVLVTGMTNPDWVPLMKKAAAIVTDRGGRTCHAAIVSRELGIPALVGTLQATKKLSHNQTVTVDCSTGSTGTVYDGLLTIKRSTMMLDQLPTLTVPFMLNMSVPASAFSLAYLPVAGVGLARIEFIIANNIQVHPLALIQYKKLPVSLQKTIKRISAAYQSPKQFFVHVLAEQCATIAAAFWPKPVLVRLSDFKSNEYCELIGGALFESAEQNPMLGRRGAFRYYHDPYNAAFALECAAIKYAREIKGFTNIQLMIPMVRTVHEAAVITRLLRRYGLYNIKPHMKVIFMCEVPASALCIKDLSRYCDGFSIGSNDLTQFTLAIDRDDELLATTFSEQDPAVLQLMELAINGAHQMKRKIGICGQGPSDYPALRDWLIKHHIDYLSLNADSLISMLLR